MADLAKKADSADVPVVKDASNLVADILDEAVSTVSSHYESPPTAGPSYLPICPDAAKEIIFVGSSTASSSPLRTPLVESAARQRLV